jgi:GT2 family glycosyltransferase
MKSIDLSPGRWRSRWRKLRRDPAAFADDLPWPLARSLAVAGLSGMTRAADLFDRETRVIAEDWARRDVRLVRMDDDDRYALRDRSGAPPSPLPDRLWIAPSGRRLVACVFDADDVFLSGAEVDPGDGAVVSLPGAAAAVRIQVIDGGGDPPGEFEILPVGRTALVRRARARGAGAAEALHEAWPAQERRNPEPTAAAYRDWIARNEPGPADAAAIRAWLGGIEGLPVVSVLMPVHDPQPHHLRAAIRSVQEQIHARWQLCIADDGSASPLIRRLLDEVAADDPRIGITRLGVSRGVAVATNAALERAEGEVCLFLDHDDVIAPHALALIAAAFAAEPAMAAVYSDEDTLDAHGRRSAPLFKPDFDGERLLSQNYVNHAFAVRTELLRRLGGVRDGVDGAQDHDLVLRIAEAGAAEAGHIPQVLYHWRVYPGGRTLSQRGRADLKAARRLVVADALARRGVQAEVGFTGRGHAEVRVRLAEPAPSILAIVPTRDRAGLLEACAAGLLRHTDYPKLRLRIVDNGSRAPSALAALEALSREERVDVLRVDAPFNFSALVNQAAADAEADLLLLLNDDVLVVEPHWLERMAALATRPGVGAVGAGLHYPDGRWQHAGLVLGLGPQGIAGHEFRGQAGDAPGPQGRLQVTREVSAVTGACLLVGRDKFEAAGGMDEELAVAFNDVDFCLKLRARGLRNVWTPQARLIHLESATRGRDADPERAARFAREAEIMRARWGELLQRDPYYNPNLTLDDESFGLAAVSRWTPPWTH